MNTGIGYRNENAGKADKINKRCKLRRWIGSMKMSCSMETMSRRTVVYSLANIPGLYTIVCRYVGIARG